MAARLAGDNRPVACRAAAIRAEVRVPGQGSAAVAAAGRDPPARGGEHLVHLPEAAIEREQVGAALGEEVLAKAVTAVHLQNQAAEVAQLLLTEAKQGAPLPADHAGRGKRPPRGRRRLVLSEPVEQRGHEDRV